MRLTGSETLSKCCRNNSDIEKVKKSTKRVISGDEMQWRRDATQYPGLCRMQSSNALSYFKQTHYYFHSPKALTQWTNQSRFASDILAHWRDDDDDIRESMFSCSNAAVASRPLLLMLMVYVHSSHAQQQNQRTAVFDAHSVHMFCSAAGVHKHQSAYIMYSSQCVCITRAFDLHTHRRATTKEVMTTGLRKMTVSIETLFVTNSNYCIHIRNLWSD